MNEWVLWKPGGVDHAARLVDIVGFDDVNRLTHGVSLRDAWPTGVRYRFDDELPLGPGPRGKASKPAQVVVPDAVRTRGSRLVASQRLAELIARNATAVELLPIGLERAPGRRWPSDAQLAQPYFIVNPVGLLECVDENRSAARRDKSAPEEIARLRRLVIDPQRIAAEISVFRARHLRREIFVRRSLITIASDAGLTGVQGQELEDFELL